MPEATKSIKQRHHLLTWWRWWLPSLVIFCYVGGSAFLLWYSSQEEFQKNQSKLEADGLWFEQTLDFQFNRHKDNLIRLAQDMEDEDRADTYFIKQAQESIQNIREAKSVQWRNKDFILLAHEEASTSFGQTLLVIDSSSLQYAKQAIAEKKAFFSKPYQPNMVQSKNDTYIDLHVPIIKNNTSTIGLLTLSISLNALLQEQTPWWLAQNHEIKLFDKNMQLLAELALAGKGKHVYQRESVINLSGNPLVLRLDSLQARPPITSNLLVSAIVALVSLLIVSLWLLWQDMRQKSQLSKQLKNEVAFRKAMEESLVTGLRARNLEGKTTYANAAFCKMVGYDLEELLAQTAPMPYWAEEKVQEFKERREKILAGTITSEPFETVFKHRSGKHISVVIYEAPLIDAQGRHTGWMSSILDISEQKRIEAINRQQEEKAQATAGLITMGELASSLAHELNQPLAAISTYIMASLNLLKSGKHSSLMLLQTLEKTYAQSQRAGKIIFKIYDMVQTRDPKKIRTNINNILTDTLPLIQILRKKTFFNLRTSIRSDLPNFEADPILIEQVLLNLVRNAADAMHDMPENLRILEISATTNIVEETGIEYIEVSVIDQGSGVAENIHEDIFSAFFSTKNNGLGMGLKVCRSIIEYHHGTLWHEENLPRGSKFIFRLPIGPIQ